MRPLLAVIALIPLAGCTSGKAGNAVFGDRTYDFPAIHADAAADFSGLCQSATLGNDAPIYVNTVEMAADPGWHHSNWFFVPDTMYSGPDGTWNCNARGFDEFQAAGYGGVLFAQSTQSTGESQAFPPGAAMKLPAHARIVGDVHIVNATATAIDTAIHLTLRTIPEDQVTVKLHPMSMAYSDLLIPPSTQSRFTGRCDVLGGAPLDFKIYYVLPHYHRYGTGMTLTAGANEEISIFSNTGSIGEAWGKTLDPPVNVSGQTRINFSCNYNNTTTSPLDWQNSNDGEMCVLLAYTDSPVKWVGGVLNGSAYVGSSGNVSLYEGPCSFGSI